MATSIGLAETSHRAPNNPSVNSFYGLDATVENKNLIKRQFTDFLEEELEKGKYAERLRDLLEQGKTRLVVSLDDLRAFDHLFARNLLQYPAIWVPAMEEAVKEYALYLRPDLDKSLHEFRIAFRGSFGARQVSPRGLLAEFLGGLVRIEGIVTRCSLVRPKLVLSTHYCPATNKFTTRTYSDGVTLDQNNRGIGIAVYPSKDDQGNLLETEFGLCKFRDQQKILVQEMPENAPAGQLPRSIEIVAEDDLVDLCKPGDRIHIAGVYRAIPGAGQRTGGSGVFRSIVVANDILQVNEDASKPQLSESDLYLIHQVASSEGHFDILARSIAPSIYGHDQVKKALLLQLLGGSEKNLDNGTHLRGDINILLVGDPSTAKSQLLRFVMNIAPLSISTTGRGSSGVGLTAAVTHDQDTDRVAIHEVMEQQTVTIAKAGIHASLNARCSVLAAANPQYGSYNKHKKPQENIALPDSLLSRFDLLFIVLDNISAQRDRDVAGHVLTVHQMPDRHIISSENEESTLFSRALCGQSSPKDITFSVSFLKKFIYYAKTRVKPVLTEEAAEYISQVYRDLRQQNSDRTLPITARQLETLIRLSTAHAKCRLSHEVTAEDAQLAEEILLYSLYNDARPIKKKQIKRKRQSESCSQSLPRFGSDTARGSHSNDDIYYFNEEEEDELAERARNTLRRPSQVIDNSNDPEAIQDLTETDQVMADDSYTERDQMLDEADKENTFMSDDAMTLVKEAIDKVTSEKMSEQCSLREVMNLLDKQGMEQDEVERCLNLLQGAGLIMYHDQIIFRI
ncbi:DNA replication licensing factor MCM3 homolog 1 [Galdieria sulphuraria]|nr:DNA replication licensing factor MCM3 homolog 1 [Galdieria sulphuraria]